MKTVVLCSLLLLVFSVTSSPLQKSGKSDLIIGKLNPGDTKLSIIKAETLPLPGISTTSAFSGMSSEYINISQVTAIESGEYDDARVKLVEGGPGFNHVKLQFISGPSGGYNYTINIYGVELEQPVKKS